jgi:hypothetical protein
VEKTLKWVIFPEILLRCSESEHNISFYWNGHMGRIKRVFPELEEELQFWNHNSKEPGVRTKTGDILYYFLTGLGYDVKILDGVLSIEW